MKDWEWFALGLIPFAGAPVQVIRYLATGQTSGPAQIAAGAVAGQATAWALQKAGFYKVNEALMLYRLQSLGFVEEGVGRTGYSLVRGKPVTGVRNIKGSGVGWRATFPMRMASPLMMAMFIGTIANHLSTSPGHRRHGYWLERSAAMQGIGLEEII